MQANDHDAFEQLHLMSPNLILRPLQASDASVIYQLRSKDNPYIDRDPCRDVAEAAAFIQTIQQKVASKESLYWAIQPKDSNEMTGAVLLFHFSQTDNNAEIGFEQLPEASGKGYMTEAVSKVLTYAFEVLSLQRIEAVVHRENDRSAKLIARLGFVKTQKSRDLFEWHELLSNAR